MKRGDTVHSVACQLKVLLTRIGKLNLEYNSDEIRCIQGIQYNPTQRLQNFFKKCYPDRESVLIKNQCYYFKVPSRPDSSPRTRSRRKTMKEQELAPIRNKFRILKLKFFAMTSQENYPHHLYCKSPQDQKFIAL